MQSYSNKMCEELVFSGFFSLNQNLLLLLVK
jgi:hypothetical protein